MQVIAELSYGDGEGADVDLRCRKSEGQGKVKEQKEKRRTSTHQIHELKSRFEKVSFKRGFIRPERKELTWAIENTASKTYFLEFVSEARALGG